MTARDRQGLGFATPANRVLWVSVKVVEETPITRR